VSLGEPPTAYRPLFWAAAGRAHIITGFRQYERFGRKRYRHEPTLHSSALPQRPPLLQALRDSPTFYTARKSSTVFETALHRPCREEGPVDSYLRYILILYTNVVLVFKVVSVILALPPIYIHSCSPFVLHALSVY
jgi:hypothetical protein